MKKFYLAGVLGALLCALPLIAIAAPKADATKAPDKVPLVTRDNFVSLELFSRVDDKHDDVHLRLDNGGLRIKFERPKRSMDIPLGQTIPFPYAWSEPAPMSWHQIQAVFKLLNDAQFPQLVGLHQSKGKYTGFFELLTLTISDDKGRDQTFEIDNEGGDLPEKYHAIVSLLRDIQVHKFSAKNLPIPIDDWVTENNFSSLTLETTGGFAGTRSLLEIKPRPGNSSLGGWVMSWSQATRGLKQLKEIELGNIEELILHLNSAHLANYDGKSYKEKNLADGFNETLTVALNNGQTFTVSNYGNTAPPDYSEFIQYLNETRSKALRTQ